MQTSGIMRLFVVSLVVWGGVATQSGHADQLILKNGDRITGQVKRIWDEEVFIEPDYTDEFAVEIDAVAYIDADRDFEIELADGRSVTAQLGGVNDEGKQLVQIEGEAIGIPLADLLELEEPEDFFDWKTNIDLNSAINKGNTDSEKTSLRARGNVKLGDHRHIGDFLFADEEQDGASTKQQALLSYSYNWLFRDPWYFAATGSFERDPIRELKQRLIATGGIGRDIWNQPRRALSVELGLGFSTEEIGDMSEDNAVAAWVLRYRHDVLGGDLELFHNQSITTNIGGRSNTVVKTSTGVQYEITDLLYATLSLDFDFESDPADLAENEDLALLFGLGVEFE